MDKALEYVLTFVGGFVIGYLSRTIQDSFVKSRTDTKINRVLLEEIVAFVVVVAWLISVFVSVVYPDRQVPLAVHILMGAVVGFIYKNENPILSLIAKNVSIRNDEKPSSKNTP